jgi:hypothetical protein
MPQIKANENRIFSRSGAGERRRSTTGRSKFDAQTFTLTVARRAQ